MFKVHSDKDFEQISQIETTILWPKSILTFDFAIADALGIPLLRFIPIRKQAGTGPNRRHI